MQKIGKPLINRDVLLDRESLICLALRVGRLNYYSPRDIFELLLGEDKGKEGAGRYAQVCYPKDYDTLLLWSEYFLIDPAVLFDASNHRFANLLARPNDSANYIEWSDGSKRQISRPIRRQIPSLLSSIFWIRYCPLCLRTSAHHRLNWMPTALNICTEHHCLLLDACPGCRKRISLQELLDRCCHRCGMMLCDANVISVEGDHEGTVCQSAIESWFGLSDRIVAPESLGFPKVSPALAYRLMIAIYRCLLLREDQWEDLISPIPKIIDMAEKQVPYAHAARGYLLYQACFAALQNWPHNLFAFLDAYGKSGPLKSFALNLRSVWSRLSRAVANIPESRYIVQEIINYSLDRNIPIPDSIAATYGTADWFIEQTGSLSPELSFSALGIDMSDLDRLPYGTRDELKCSPISGFFNREKVKALAEEWRDGWGVSDTAYWLGLSTQTVDALVELGELAVQKHNVDGTYLIDHKSSRNLFQRVSQQLEPRRLLRDQYFGLLPLDQLYLYGISKTAEAKFLRCVEKGYIPAFEPTLAATWQLGKINIPTGIAQPLSELILMERNQGMQGSGGAPAPQHSDLQQPSAPTTLQPVEYETLRGYLERFKQANNHKESDWTNRLLEIPYGTELNLVTNSGHIRHFADFLGMSVDQVNTMTIHCFAPRIIGAEKWDRKTNDIFLSESKGLRICPYCYAETRTFLLPWLLRQVTTCQKHRVFLLDHCSVCGKKLSSDDDKCLNCNTLLIEMKATPIDEHDLASVTWSDLVYKAINSDNPMGLAAEPFPFSALDTRQFFSTLIKLSALLLEYDVVNPRLELPKQQMLGRHGLLSKVKGKDNLGHDQIMSAAIDVLLDWPNNWQAALERILRGSDLNVHGDLVFQKRVTFPSKLRRLLESEPELTWLWDEFLEFVRFGGQGLPGIELWENYLSNESGTDAQSKTEMSFKSIVGRTKTNAEKEKMLTFDEARNYLGIDHETFDALMKRGLIDPEETRKTTDRSQQIFGRSHLESAITYLVGHLEVKDFYFVEEEIVWLGEAATFVDSPQLAWIDILSAIHCQQVKAFRQPGVNGLNAIWMTLYELRDYGRIVTEHALLSFDSTLQLLRCEPEALMHLATSGILRPWRGYPGKDIKMWCYDRNSITNFLKRYVNAEAAAEVFSYSPAVLRTWAEEGLIQAVSGIGGVNEYRFDSEGSLQWNFGRLITKEVCETLGISQHTIEVWMEKQVRG